MPDLFFLTQSIGSRPATPIFGVKDPSYVPRHWVSAVTVSMMPIKGYLMLFICKINTCSMCISIVYQYIEYHGILILFCFLDMQFEGNCCDIVLVQHSCSVHEFIWDGRPHAAKSFCEGLRAEDLGKPHLRMRSKSMSGS